jgi:hypothetical protein
MRWQELSQYENSEQKQNNDQLVSRGNDVPDMEILRTICNIGEWCLGEGPPGFMALPIEEPIFVEVSSSIALRPFPSLVSGCHDSQELGR